MKKTLIAIILLTLVCVTGCGSSSDTNASKETQENEWIEILINQERRVAAEWEPAVGVVVSWKLNVPHTLLQAIAKNDTIYLMVDNEDEKAVARESINAWGISESKVKYYVTQQGGSYWNSRDWASFSVFNKSGDFEFYDGRYYYPFANLDNEILFWQGRDQEENFAADDAASEVIAKDMGFKRTDLDISLTGGNMFFDGLGKLFTTEVYTKENEELGHPKDDMLAILKDHLGVTKHHEVKNYEELGIQHIDVLMMMLDQERFLVKRVPSGHSSYQRIEDIVKSLSTLTNSFGRPYEVLRIDTPQYDEDSLANYTNSLILNKHIYVPLFNIPGDEAALNTWRKVMPGYEVLGFQYTDLELENGWSFTDALHCRTKQIHDPEMLHMVHKHIDKATVPADSFEILVYIRDYSNTGLASNDLNLFWRLQGEYRWTKESLDLTTESRTYQAYIKGPSVGQTVEYYLTAADNSGRSGTLPIIAPTNLYSFYIDDNSTIDELK